MKAITDPSNKIEYFTLPPDIFHEIMAEVGNNSKIQVTVEMEGGMKKEMEELKKIVKTLKKEELMEKEMEELKKIVKTLKKEKKKALLVVWGAESDLVDANQDFEEAEDNLKYAMEELEEVKDIWRYELE